MSGHRTSDGRSHHVSAAEALFGTALPIDFPISKTFTDASWFDALSSTNPVGTFAKMLLVAAIKTASRVAGSSVA